MSKKILSVLIIFSILLLSTAVIAQTTTLECNWWCKVKQFFGGSDALVGQAIGDYAGYPLCSSSLTPGQLCHIQRSKLFEYRGNDNFFAVMDASDNPITDPTPLNSNEILQPRNVLSPDEYNQQRLNWETAQASSPPPLGVVTNPTVAVPDPSNPAPVASQPATPGTAPLPPSAAPRPATRAATPASPSASLSGPPTASLRLTPTESSNIQSNAGLLGKSGGIEGKYYFVDGRIYFLEMVRAKEIDDYVQFNDLSYAGEIDAVIKRSITTYGKIYSENIQIVPDENAPPLLTSSQSLSTTTRLTEVSGLIREEINIIIDEKTVETDLTVDERGLIYKNGVRVSAQEQLELKDKLGDEYDEAKERAEKAGEVRKREKELEAKKIQESIGVEGDKILLELQQGKKTHEEVYNLLKIEAEGEKAKADELIEVGKKPSEQQLRDAKEGSTIKIGDKTYTKKNGNFVDSEGKTPKEINEGKDIPLDSITDLITPDAQQAQANAKKIEDKADSIEWQGDWWQDILGTENYDDFIRGGLVLIPGDKKNDLPKLRLGDIGSSLSEFQIKISRYQGISHAIFNMSWWVEAANNEDLRNLANFGEYVTANACRIDDKLSAKEPGQSARMVVTLGGSSIQAVGAIQAEKSSADKLIPIRCEKNPNEEAEEEYICRDGLVCKDNAFCYKDEDAKDPEMGHYYKITWGVTAPRDEKFTPYVNEDGVAVKFNIVFRGDGVKYVYKRSDGTSGTQVLELMNGENDGATLVRYLKQNYNEVCIDFDEQYAIRDEQDPTDHVQEICADIKVSVKGEVDYGKSTRVASTTSKDTGVVVDI